MNLIMLRDLTQECRNKCLVGTDIPSKRYVGVPLNPQSLFTKLYCLKHYSHIYLMIPIYDYTLCFLLITLIF